MRSAEPVDQPVLYDGRLGFPIVVGAGERLEGEGGLFLGRVLIVEDLVIVVAHAEVTPAQHHQARSNAIIEDDDRSHCPHKGVGSQVILAILVRDLRAKLAHEIKLLIHEECLQ